MKYRDIDIFLTKNTDTNDILFVSGTSAIVQSIKNIVLTRNGERPFNKSFGTKVIDLLFDNPSPADLAFLQYDIFKILQRKEPRITVSDVSIDYPSTDPGIDLKINISYTIGPQSNLGNTQTLVLTVTPT
jgi:phage baseplate assembly protein W